MENISVKFQEDVIKRMDECINKHNFNSRTEFIREAVRDKLENLSTEEIMKEFMKFHGKGRPTTDEQDEITREKVSKELLAYYNKKFNLE